MKFLELLKDKQWRKYWLLDPFWGSLDYLTHYGLRYLPIQVNAKVGGFLGEIAGKYRFKAANVRVKRSLSVLHPDLSDSERNAITIKMWRNIGQSMTEYSILDKIYTTNRVTLKNAQYLQTAVDAKQPVVLVFAHTGNWEVFGNYILGYGLDLMSLYKPVRNRFARQIADKARARMGGGIKLIDADAPNAMRLLCKHLSNKNSVWIAIDEVKNNQVKIPAFGRKSEIEGTNLSFAIRLAQRYAAVIIPVWARRERGNHFTVTLGEPITVAPSAEGFTQTFAKLEQELEAWIRDNLEQWYMLHELRL